MKGGGGEKSSATDGCVQLRRKMHGVYNYDVRRLGVYNYDVRGQGKVGTCHK